VDYALRAMSELAAANAPRTVEQLSEAQRLPNKYLEAILGELRRTGLLRSQRGPDGGYRLARPAGEIAMTDAVRALEGPLLEMPCAGADDLEHCDRPQPCSVHEVFQRVYETLSISLGATNLADVAATAGGPPYPPAVRRRVAAEHLANQQEARNA